MTDETLPAEVPVETPVPVEVQAEPVEAQADDPSLPEDKPKGGFQRRIKELADERNHWREMALRAQPEPKVEPEPPPPPVSMPKLEDFGYDEAKYQAALLSHASELARVEARKEIEQERKKTAEQQRLSTFAERQREFAKTNPDFTERVMQNPTLPITPAMREVILDSPSGPEIAYYLANNQDRAEQIASLPPHLAALEMGRIEGRLQAMREVKRAPSAVTTAPPPPPTIEAVEPEVDKDPDSMTIDQWVKWREKDLRKRR